MIFKRLSPIAYLRLIILDSLVDNALVFFYAAAHKYHPIQAAFFVFERIVTWSPFVSIKVQVGEIFIKIIRNYVKTAFLHILSSQKATLSQGEGLARHFYTAYGSAENFRPNHLYNAYRSAVKSSLHCTIYALPTIIITF